MTVASQKAAKLVRRYLDPDVRWSQADDRSLRTLLRDSPEAAAVYNRMVARHRVMAGGTASLPSGFELGRMAGAAAGQPPAASPWRPLTWIVPAAAAALALVLALTPAPTRAPEYLAARGLHENELEPNAGLGIGGVTADDQEYEAIFSHEIHLDDWLRLSFTNERPELQHLFVVALQPERPEAERVVWVAPTPDEGQSLPITVARYRNMPFEVRLGARHTLGKVVYLAVFSEQPVTVEAMRAALDPSATTTLPSALEPLIRERLRLSPRDVVQVLETRVVTGSGSTPLDPGKEVP